MGRDKPAFENMGGGNQGSFDLLKVILAYVVILRHFMTFILPKTPNSGVLICETISTAAVPLFFTLSGYLFFSKPFSIRRLKRQLMRVLKLYLRGRWFIFRFFCWKTSKTMRHFSKVRVLSFGT